MMRLCLYLFITDTASIRSHQRSFSNGPLYRIVALRIALNCMPCYYLPLIATLHALLFVRTIAVILSEVFHVLLPVSAYPCPNTFLAIIKMAVSHLIVFIKIT